MANEIERLPRLIERAMATLNEATTSAEILDAINHADVAYVAAKMAARLTKIKDAHTTVMAVCRRTMRDALIIEARAECRLADEYDAAQERGEVHKHGGQGKRDVPNQNIPSKVDEIGLTRKQVHEARQVRDAEKVNPGIIRKALNDQVEAGKEPTRADVKRAISGDGVKDRKPRRKPGETQAQRSITTTQEEWDRFKNKAEAEGSSAAAKLGELIKEQDIDRNQLSMSAQQKLDAAIRQHKSKLDGSFHQAVNARVKAWLEETILPQHRKEQAEAKAVMSARKGIMDKAAFNKIRRALHPDSRLSISDKLLAEAFDTFMALEKRLLSEKHSPATFADLPTNIADWDKMRKTRAKQNDNRSVRPR